MKFYLPISDTAIIVDASSENTETIAKKDKDCPLNILNQTIWKKLERGGYGR